MPGGVMQLVAIGAQDQYLIGSPSMSYFKSVVKTHVHFALESVRQTFLSKPTLDINRNTFTCRIGRVGDLLRNVFLSFELPDIYSTDEFRFQWIENLAKYMIHSVSLRIDTQLVDQVFGEYLDISTELTMPTGQSDTFDRMTGNVEEFVAPKALKERVIIRNNKVSFSYYPESTGPGSTPSIKGRRFFVPLSFWFTRSPTLALPLIALQYQNVDVTIEFRGIEELYQVYDDVTETYVSPGHLRSLRQQRGLPVPNVGISAFTYKSGSVDLDAYLECEFAFLDESERLVLAHDSRDYIVERVYRSEQTGVRTIATIDLVLSNPVKEIIWITRRSDANLYNNWKNLTATNPEDSNSPVLKTAKIMWNGMDRIEEKPSAYFNLLQAYQHHTRGPREGIYSYSFALHPEKIQPSGQFNASMINKIQLYLTTNALPEEEYEVIVYSLYYNVFRVMGGSGNMVFAS